MDAPASVAPVEKNPPLANGIVKVDIDLAAGTYSITDAKTGEVTLADAGFGADVKDGATVAIESRDEVEDELGKGRRIILAITDMHLFRHSFRKASNAVPAKKLVSFTVYEGRPALILGFGLKTPIYESIRMMSATPLSAARYFPGKKLENPVTLNGGAGADPNFVTPGATRHCSNSMLLTGTVDGIRRSIVWGGLTNGDFGKAVRVADGVVSATAEDPIGRLVPTDTTYLAPDTIYVDAITAEPFAALEQYGLAMRAATRANPGVYDFPVLCGWSVGHLSGLPNVNNSAKLVGELEAGNKAGIGKYTKIGVRLEPDKYQGDTEQGWWDDEHWAKFKHLVPPYTTVESWCKAVTERNGVPYIYFQSGMPSADYARKFPQYMLFNDISDLGKKHANNMSYVTFDYTDKDFSAHVVDTWKRLRKEGIIGVKFDYPETAWCPQGGFDDRYATTTSAYRRVFGLVREGFGPGRLIDERNLGISGRPMLDVTAGIVDTQRTWDDSNGFTPEMVTIDGLRWYKNRTVFNYYPDTKTIHNLKPDIRKSMLTMLFLSSGRFDMATSYSLFTPEMTYDFTRVFPHYREPKTARPLDAFTGVKNPQVYDLAITPDWHQIAFFNTSDKKGVVSTAISGALVDNAVGLDAGAKYHAYEFWTDTYLGKLDGTARVERELAPKNCAMISLRKAGPNPQVLSTNRHILQGHIELDGVRWDAASKTLSGTAKVIGGETMKIVVAGNGAKAAKVSATGAKAGLAAHPGSPDLAVLSLECDANTDVTWSVSYE